MMNGFDFHNSDVMIRQGTKLMVLGQESYSSLKTGESIVSKYVDRFRKMPIAFCPAERERDVFALAMAYDLVRGNRPELIQKITEKNAALGHAIKAAYETIEPQYHKVSSDNATTLQIKSAKDGNILAIAERAFELVKDEITTYMIREGIIPNN